MKNFQCNYSNSHKSIQHRQKILKKKIGVTTSVLDTKITEVDGKIPDLSG